MSMAPDMTTRAAENGPDNAQAPPAELSSDTQHETTRDDDDESADPEGGEDRDKNADGGRHGDEDEDDTEEEDDEEEREPTLKYAKLTSNLRWIYRNGDATSAYMVSGDKMIIGTDHGNVHTLSIPALKPIRTYSAHSSPVSAISVSPYLSAFPASASSASSSRSATTPQPIPKPQPASNTATSPKNSPSRPPVPATPSNAIYIATSSLDGHVCVSSLVDPKDVTLRNYARPVHAVALSPAFKSDRTYLSGGVAGELILTVGGKLGVSADADTNGSATGASSWLGTLGLGSKPGKDTVLHANEGIITSIKWSLSGRYVVWNNEYGTRIMRSHLLLGEATDLAWKRIRHVPRPNRRLWEDNAAIWKARAEWIDDKSLNALDTSTDSTATAKPKLKRLERLLVGWGDTVWMLHVHSGDPNYATNGVPAKTATLAYQFRFSDCIVSGLTLYTPTILVALVYPQINDDNDATSNSISASGTPRKGRQNGVAPEVRLIDVSTDSPDKPELETESLVVRDFERLSGARYFLSHLFMPPTIPASTQRSTLEAFGSGLRDVTFNPTRLFSSSASILSGSSSEGKTTSVADAGQVQSPSKFSTEKDIPPSLANPGLKIFIHSPFDCIIAVKRDVSDQLAWLLDREEYEEAWNLVDSHPEIISTSAQVESRPETPTKSGQNLKEFFDDDVSSQITMGPEKAHSIAVEKEKQRIGGKWIKQLISENNWVRAGEVAGRVLGDSQEWADVILTFARAGKFDEITPYIPITDIKPPLPSFVYEMILGHYINHDKERLQRLLEQWSPTLFKIPVVASAIKNSLESDNAEQESLEDEAEDQETRALLKALAKLYLADNNPSAAIRCYVRTRSADEVMSLIRDYHKVDAISDDIFVFIRIRITPEQQANAPLDELDELSSDAIGILVSAALQSIIAPSIVVSQLEPKAPASSPYLFFYFRSLWLGDVPEDPSAAPTTKPITQRKRRYAPEAEMKSRTLLAPHADLVVALFAEYSQTLLNDFLQAQAVDYNFALATEVCRRHGLIPELVYLLSVTGQSSEALHLIINRLDDVKAAVQFAKKSKDPSLWLDLLDYSMDKPRFIVGLLEEVGTSIDPVTLVRRIPKGLEVPGLKEGLERLVNASGMAWSITEGASKILKSDVAIVLTALRRRRERGVVFDVKKAATTEDVTQKADGKSESGAEASRNRSCASCGMSFASTPSTQDTDNDADHLIGFACGHLFHLNCLLDALVTDANKSEIVKLERDLRDADLSADRSLGQVGIKVRHAQMIQKALGDFGCSSCKRLVSEETALDID